MGFVFGFLIGAGAAAVFAKIQQKQQQGQDDATLLSSAETSASGTPSAKDIMGKIKQQMHDANVAAKEASLEKQEHMLREYESGVHRNS
jgi:hypothetical protein